MIGVFISLDLFLFYVFWDAMLIPMYFLIGIWGYDQRIYAAVKFMLYTMAGSVLMLVAILGARLPAQRGDRQLQLRPAQALRARHRAGDAALALPGVRARLRHQGAAVPVPHLAARRARAGADGRLGDPGRRAAEDGHLRPGALRLPALPGSGRLTSRPGSRCWRSSASSTARWCAMVQPDMKKLVAYSSVSHLGLRRARHLRDERAGRAGRRLPDAGARRQHRRALPDRRHAVRPPPHAPDQRVRRPQEA